MRSVWRRLPGAAPVKAVEALVIVVVALVALALVFEWAGDLLDSGGAIRGR